MLAVVLVSTCFLFLHLLLVTLAIQVSLVSLRGKETKYSSIEISCSGIWKIMVCASHMLLYEIVLFHNYKFPARNSTYQGTGTTDLAHLTIMRLHRLRRCVILPLVIPTSSSVSVLLGDVVLDHLLLHRGQTIIGGAGRSLHTIWNILLDKGHP